MVRWLTLFGSMFVFGQLSLQAQSLEHPGSRNAFGIVAEYSNDSSRIILGSADNVKMGSLGLQYQRRLLDRPHFVLSYAAEFRPVVLESIPTVISTFTERVPNVVMNTSPPELTLKCVANSRIYKGSYGNPPTAYDYTITTTCSRLTDYAQGFAPLGVRVNFRPNRRLQPTVSTFEGYLFSTQPLPISYAGSFNFSFEFGAGFEYYRSPTSSIRFEYQVQHYSNKGTAPANPGVDNGLFKLTYSFGR